MSWIIAIGSDGSGNGVSDDGGGNDRIISRGHGDGDPRPRFFHDEAASAYAESSILEIKQLHECVAEAER